ncbi:hypothetical protein C900_01758 [Fulvivirga imtechensis AK7]|uniref:Lipoprotein n=1 Tax=Fulvivirga imtechensis AK7 TaxID=1237149 RepID=L8JX50_9BACT|nr:DUF6452 family protein [Fulvivirga imtechensis]ELR72204.1 hypothetical protein C900_01758 [Fulvivirga imtechensis AK7]
MRIIIAILFIMAVMLMSACNEPDCQSKTTNFVNVKFYKIENNELDTLTILSITAIAADDTVFVENLEVSSVRLPLRPDTTATVFAFDSNFGRDTLILTYRKKARLISENCGVEVIFSDLGYSRNDFDSIKVVNQTLIEDITEDVKIYN